MSTRKLILTALACGLAILVAGGVFLFNVARNRDELTVPDARRVGEVVEVGPYRAGVVRADWSGDVLLVRVRVTAVEQRLLDAASPWSVLIGGAIAEVVDSPLSSVPPCGGTAVEQGGSLECVLAYSADKASGFAEFAVGEAKDRWFLPG
ncbi:MAG TPA: hypothetical protein VF855_13840 [Acidimicrobiales bacterium]